MSDVIVEWIIRGYVAAIFAMAFWCLWEAINGREDDSED